MTANTNNDPNSRLVASPVATIRRLVLESINTTEITEEFNNNDNDTTISSNVTDADQTILETEAWNNPPDQVTLDDPDLVPDNDFSWTGNGTSSLSVSEQLAVERQEAVAKRQPVDATRPVVPSKTSPPIATNDNGNDDDDDGDDGEELPDIAVSTTSSNTTIEVELQDEGILPNTSNNVTDTEETIAELELELQKEEEEAEQESALQDAELDAQGYVDGTPPLGTDDEIPSSMEMSPQPPPVEQGQGDGEVEGGDDDNDDDEVEGVDDDEVEGGDDDNDDDEVDGVDDDEVEGGDDDNDDEVDPNEDATIDVEKDVEIWEDVEEWNEATEEHDKEWFQEYERTHSIDPATPTPTAASPKASSGKSNTTKTNNEIPKPQPGTINVHRPPDDNDTQEIVDEKESSQSKGNSPSDGTIGDGNLGKGVNKLSPSPVPVNKLSPSPVPVNKLSPPPVPSPFASPTSSTSSKNNPTSPPGIIADKTSSNPHSLGFYAGVSLVPIILLFCLGKYVCRPKRPGDKRGEYRAVAARYGDMGYDNTFSDAMSDDEDDDFMDGHGDIEDDSWGKAGKRTLELPKLKKERNGGLSLAEMNG